MLFWLVLIVFIISLINVVLLKKRTTILLCISFISAALLLIHIGSGTALHLKQENIVIFLKRLVKVEQIAWDNEEQLLSLSFEKRESEGIMIYESLPIIDDSRLTFFQIWVEENDEQEIQQTYDLKKHKNLLYKVNSSYGYDNILFEFIHYPQTASRGYEFYVNNSLISVREHNDHDTSKLFETHMQDLVIDD